VCGIAGFVTSSFSEELSRALKRALVRLAHRGPDDEGSASFPAQPTDGRPAVALGNRRLAILDLTRAGRQPMTSADGRWTLVTNGEIYNYLELRDELRRSGVAVRSKSDTEVLVAAWAAWGVACLPRLLGMFAMAVHDSATDTTYLARDPFGIKPLYWARCGPGLAFASEIRALLEFPGISRRVDPQRLHDFLTRSSTDSGGATLLADIRQVPAGCWLAVRGTKEALGEPERYWQLNLRSESELTFEEAAERVRAEFVESIRLHLRSDAKVGFALSGGLDSSAVVMASRGVLGPDGDIHAFSFIPDDRDIDEERHSDLVAHAAGAWVHKVRLSAQDLRHDAETLAEIQGEPFASPVIYAQYRVMKAASEAGLKVLLGGQGADEILAGYDRYLPARMASLLRRGRVVAAWRLGRDPVTQAPVGRVGAFSRALVRALPRVFETTARRIARPGDLHPAWLDAAWFAERGVGRQALWSARGLNVMREMLADNLLESQIQALMRYEDRNAMAHSVENRVPFLHVPLVELLFTLPERYLLAPDGTRKAVFRRAMRGIVPEPIVARTDKVGFSVPTVLWFEALRPWIADRLRLAGNIPGLVQTQVEMRRLTMLSSREWRDPLLVWRLVSLATWVERFEATF